MRIWVDIQDTSGNKAAVGPINTAYRWVSVRRMDRAGRFSFEMPAADSRAATLAMGSEVHCYGIVDDDVTELGAGIIERIDTRVQPQGPAALVVTGDDLLRELAFSTVGDLELYDQGTAWLSDSISLKAYMRNDFRGQDTAMGEAVDGGTATDWRGAMYYKQAADEDRSFLYVGGPTRFQSTKFLLNGITNDNAGTLRAQYFNEDSGWLETTVTADDTKGGEDQSSLFQTGGVTITRPDEWHPTVHAGFDRFWLRYFHTATATDSIDFSEIQIKEELGSSTPVTDIIAAANPALGSWSQTGESATAVYLVFQGETVLAALTRVAEVTGEHFRLGTARELVWLSSITTSGYRAVLGARGPGVRDVQKLCIIQEINELQDSYDVVSRVYPYGAGMGRSRVTLANATDTYAGYTIDAANNYIEYDAATRAVYRYMNWPDVGAPYDDDVESERASNQLLAAAYQYLVQHNVATKTYNVRVLKLDGTVSPGQSVKVVAHHWVDAYHAVNIDDDLDVLETTTEIDRVGIRTVGMRLSTVDWWPDTDAATMARMYRGYWRILGTEKKAPASEMEAHLNSPMALQGGVFTGVYSMGTAGGTGGTLIGGSVRYKDDGVEIDAGTEYKRETGYTFADGGGSEMGGLYGYDAGTVGAFVRVIAYDNSDGGDPSARLDAWSNNGTTSQALMRARSGAGTLGWIEIIGEADIDARPYDGFWFSFDDEAGHLVGIRKGGDLTGWTTMWGVDPDEGVMEFSGTAFGTSAKDPATDAPDDWVEIQIAGGTYYVPAYAAS